jgi:hypothetical protein
MSRSDMTTIDQSSSAHLKGLIRTHLLVALATSTAFWAASACLVLITTNKTLESCLENVTSEGYGTMDQLKLDPQLTLKQLLPRTLPWIHWAGRILRLVPEVSLIPNELSITLYNYHSFTYGLVRDLLVFRLATTAPSRVFRWSSRCSWGQNFCGWHWSFISGSETVFNRIQDRQ